MVFTYNYKTRYIHPHELLQHLNSYRYEHYTEHRFRSLVVGPARDEGVLIVSSSVGYKQPCSTRDIYDFFNYYNQQIQPMLTRLGQCHRALELATGGELDVLGQPEYARSRSCWTKLDDRRSCATAWWRWFLRGFFLSPFVAVTMMTSIIKLPAVTNITMFTEHL